MKELPRSNPEKFQEEAGKILESFREHPEIDLREKCSSGKGLGRVP